MQKIVEIAQSEYISLFLGNLIVKKENKKVTIPTRDIDVLVFENARTTMSIALINKLIEEKTNVIICDNKHNPIAQILAINGYYDNKVFLWQINWNDSFRNNVWNELIKLKIYNTWFILEELNLISDCNTQFKEWIEDVIHGDIKNIEAQVARFSFKILFGKKFKRERDTEECTNLYLNYSYTILNSFIARHLVSKGLDNRIGLKHKSFNNFFALACDVMEPLRPLMDIFVYKQIIRNENSVNFKQFKEKLFIYFYETYVLIQGKKTKIIDYIDLIITSIIQQETIMDLKVSEICE
ncbi:type II CRISPR-associated endonuclease Cas1 [Mycoplasma phocoenae]|uniref:Type II CRISPR-associated endonuclease Cas1 n=1 Tax=Mycoplasma phocoenae TaxID=754517 RepID=A0A858U155_9MOLU|nr:type II CRISPR-associated endonuclease Cas1 [Mycoplasma phocoenae]QJG66834.1 type II CRISPR-associated endonuclease Cas1 [Mycoplasma phocoenae]